jgi:hypothetical protein
VSVYTLDGANYADPFPMAASSDCPASNPQLFLSIQDEALQVDFLNVNGEPEIVNLNPTPGSPCTNPGTGLGTSNVSFPYISGIYTGIDSSNEFFALFLFSFFFFLLL